MMRHTLLLGLSAVLMLWSAGLTYAQDKETVASLSRLEGRVQVIQADSGKSVQGRNGLLLKEGDTVVTKAQTRVTIKFRDGSEVRMFPNSRFLVQGVRESSGSRNFSYKLFLKLGSVWGQFTPQRKTASIGMPTATIGIKGTTLRAVQRDGKGRVALTEGKIDVTNDRGSVTLVPGKRLADFTRGDDLRKKIQDIPYKLDMKADKRDLKFSDSKAEEVFVNVQLVNIKNGNQVNRAGKVYLRSNYEHIAFPPKVELNQRGFARVPVKISPPKPTDEQLDGNIYVWSVLDEETGDDTAEGRVLFSFPVEGSKEKIRIESDTGEGKRVN